MKLPVDPFYICVLIGFGIGTAVMALLGAMLTFNFLWIILSAASLTSILTIFYDFMAKCEEEADKYEKRR